MKTQLSMEEINAIEPNGIKVVSLFAGCGGSSLGYKLAGCEVLLANEFDKEASEVYEINHPKTILLRDDIRDVTGALILKKIGLKVGELDVLDGSPPCSSYSCMGSREKGWGKDKEYSGIIQKTDDLFFEYSRILRELQPKMFVAENVKALTFGNAKHILGSKQPTFVRERTIFNELEDCGYRITYQVLNSMHYNVPQMRERLFIIGVRNDLNITPSFPKKNYHFVSTKDAIEDLIDNGTDFKNSPKKTMLCEKYFVPGTTLTQAKRLIEKHNIKGAMMYYVRRDRWNHPFQTLLQAGDRAFHPLINRAISIWEGKRICTFPDDFILPHSPVQNWERLGRAVPPNQMKAIANHIVKLLKGSENGKTRTLKRITRNKTRSRAQRP